MPLLLRANRLAYDLYLWSFESHLGIVLWASLCNGIYSGIAVVFFVANTVVGLGSQRVNLSLG